ncbi:Interferon alpha-inducible protein 27, mitochondrial [Plecturocebus cupreus]
MMKAKMRNLQTTPLFQHLAKADTEVRRTTHELTQLLFPAATVVQAVPEVLSAMGFTGAGTAANSIAAKMMSSAAIANGGGVASGSLLATLQSLGKHPGRACWGGR